MDFLYSSLGFSNSEGPLNKSMPIIVITLIAIIIPLIPMSVALQAIACQLWGDAPGN
jgi:hypothetical protein